MGVWLGIEQAETEDLLEASIWGKTGTAIILKGLQSVHHLTLPLRTGT